MERSDNDTHTTHFPGVGLNAAQTALRGYEEYVRRVGLFSEADRKEFNALMALRPELGGPGHFANKAMPSVRLAPDEIKVRTTFGRLIELFLGVDDGMFDELMPELDIFIHRLKGAASNYERAMAEALDVPDDLEFLGAGS